MKLKLSLILLLTISVSLSSKNDSGKWSKYQGWMNWKDAKAKCNSIGMRLPTRKEFASAYKMKLTESWKKDGGYYWTTEDSLNGVYVFGIFMGNTLERVAGKGKHTRCVR